MSLQTIIAAQGRKQAWLAERLSIPENTFSYMVRGLRPVPADKIREIAKLLGVTEREVLDAIEREPAPERA